MHNVMKNILRFIFILFLIFLSLPIFSRSYAFRGLSVTEGLYGAQNEAYKTIY